jgi:hypothetical protein
VGKGLISESKGSTTGKGGKGQEKGEGTHGGDGHGEEEKVAVRVRVLSVVLLQAERETGGGRSRILRKDAHEGSRVVSAVADEFPDMDSCVLAKVQLSRRRGERVRRRSSGG